LRHISKEAAWAKVSAELVIQLRRHMARDDVQSSWGVWILILEQFYHAQSGEFVNLASRRGSVVMQRDSAKVTPAGDAVSAANARSLKRFRRLRELSKCWGAGVLPHRAKLILDALIRAEPRESVWRTRLVAVASKQLIDVLLGEAEAEVVATASLLRQFRRDRWHEWCNDPAQTAKVYRFVRQGGAPVVHPPVTQAATQPGRATVLASVDELWWKMWRPAPRALNAEPWLQALDRLPRFPAVQTLSGAHLQAIVKKAPKAKAPGRDSWTYGDLKRLPSPAFDLLAELFETVERAGAWPEPIAHSFVAMLPKGGSGDPDDYRPIVLLSVYYRIWAKARGPSFAKFLKAAGITPSAGPRAADALAYDLALRMAASIAGHAPTSGLALDWSKCYDHLVLDLLRLVGGRVGIPDAILTPMLQAYSQPRAVLLAGALAPERTPIAVLVPLTSLPLSSICTLRLCRTALRT
jgi:hypothetical protein